MHYRFIYYLFFGYLSNIMLVRMNKILFLALFMLSVNGMAQSTTTQSSFKNRAVSTKNYVINDRQETYSFRGVFTLNKRESIKSKIEKIIGLPKYYQGETVWSNINYTVSLKEGEVKANLVKNSDAEFYYYKMKELEKENSRLKKLVAEQALDISILRDVNSKNF